MQWKIRGRFTRGRTHGLQQMSFPRAARAPKPQRRGPGRAQCGNDFGIRSGPIALENGIRAQSDPEGKLFHERRSPTDAALLPVVRSLD